MKSFNRLLPALAGILTLAACGDPVEPPAIDSAAATTEEARIFTVLIGESAVGTMEVEPVAAGYEVEFEYRDNGRGPTLAEQIRLGDDGTPVAWMIEGAETFGNPVDERFEVSDGEARWKDSTGEGSASTDGPALYVPQNGSPYFLAITARALLEDEDRLMKALPGGELRLTEMRSITLEGEDGASDATVHALSGTSYDPTYFVMDGKAFLGVIAPRFAVLAQGYEAEGPRLRQLAADLAAARYADIAQRVSQDYEGPVRVRNVRIFEPESKRLGAPASVVFENGVITAVESANAPAMDGETVIDGEGGTLLPGLFEMHGHLGESGALLNIAAGVTSVRDMGNDNEVLGALIERIKAHEMLGPRVFRSGFIEGRSPFNSNNGILVESQEEAVAAVHRYADQGFERIKIYNSMKPEWIPAVISAARERGLYVMGHIPAFTSADAMIAAGYDEISHINQAMLGWVLEDGEDTRTLLRLTALKRLPELDLESGAVQATLDAMVENDVALDPTFTIHEVLLLSRNGELSPGTVDYVDHLPAAAQRQARSAWIEIGSPDDDAAYRGAFSQIMDVVRMMHERGIRLVPGTDFGGSFAYHRELELYQRIGMTAPEILAWATLGMAEHLGVKDQLGSIEPGKAADFFLVPGDPTEDLKAIKTIRMVVADGRVVFPEEVYPEFGIRPFIDAPPITRTP